MSLTKLSGTFYYRYYLAGLLGTTELHDSPTPLYPKSKYPTCGPIYKCVWLNGRRISNEVYGG
jgi:hypothetical protein